MTRRVVILGGGLGGLAAAALLQRAGLDVTLLERNEWFGGKSRRIEVAGQRIDTGPSLVTFPGVLEAFFDRFDSAGGTRAQSAREIANLTLERLPEVGRYYFQGHVTDLPVAEDHPWHQAWADFEAEHAVLEPAITELLTTDPFDQRVMGAAWKLVSSYGTRLNTEAYLSGRGDLPKALREIIAIHTLNAGVAPKDTLALYATMPAVMAHQGVYVPQGGVYEIARALARLAESEGAVLRTSETVTSVEKGRVITTEASYDADVVVSALDTGVLERLLGESVATPRRLSCSGVAVFTVLSKELPDEVVTHSVVMPDNPAELFDSLRARRDPAQTMAFLNYYRAGHIYPNDRPTAAFLLTAPPDGSVRDITDPWVHRELERVASVVGLGESVDTLIADYQVLSPGYFEQFGATGGALYGKGRPWWVSGPFHRPGYRSLTRPWLWRVGASVHPGGGIPAVLGGALIQTARLLRSLKA